MSLPNIRPPRFLARVLSKLLYDSIRAGAVEDYDEEFVRLSAEWGRGPAALWYSGQILFLLWLSLKDSLYWSSIMIQNYARITWRNILKNKVFSLINMAGLAIGIMVSLFIFLWIRDETGFDRFHAGFRDIYRLTEDQRNNDGSIFPVAVTPEPLGPGLKKDIPEVLEFTRFRPMARNLFSYGEKQIYENGLAFVDPSFLKIFTFPLIKGDPATALDHLDSMIISETAARKLFGDEDPMGRTVRLTNALDFKITGVAADVPDNSHLRFHFLGNFDFLMKTLGWEGGWWNNSYYTYVRLAPNADLGKLNSLVRIYLNRINPRNTTLLRLQPLKDIHLRSDYAIDIDGASRNMSGEVRIFALVAFLVLLIACINYMNLATARSGLRSKEVGVRKVIGAGRDEIMRQFFGESLLFAVIAGLLAAGLSRLLLPFFNALTGKTLPPAVLADPSILLFLGGAALFAGLLSGIYPALFLSSFRPVSIFRGESLSGTKSALFRKSLVVVQFALSVAFIAGTFVMTAQLRYMRNAKLGYVQDSVVHFRLRGALGENYQAFKEELARIAEIRGVTAASDLPTYTVHSTTDFEWEGKKPDDQILVHNYSVDYNFIETLGMDMAEGRAFDRKIPTDKDAFIINETAARLMGYDKSVGKILQLHERRGPIVGVVKDFHFKSLHIQIEPLVLRIEPERNAFVFVKTGFENLTGALETIRRVHAKYNPGFPLEYEFLDESLGRLYVADRRFGAVIGIFTGLAIFISCLGLFGLASFMIERRTREIGIRKILGAGLGRIAALLSKDFLKWVALADLIAIPLAYFAMSRWLRGYAYRTGMSALVFVGAAGLTLAIALLTIALHCLRAARSNPAESLRRE